MEEKKRINYIPNKTNDHIVVGERACIVLHGYLHGSVNYFVSATDKVESYDKKTGVFETCSAMYVPVSVVSQVL